MKQDHTVNELTLRGASRRFNRLRSGWIVTVSVTLFIVSTLACGTARDAGADANGGKEPRSEPIPTATAAPTPTPKPFVPTTPIAPTATPSATPVTLAQTTMPGDVDRGEVIFQETAGGVGCQLCHGKRATGVLGPDIRGMPIDRITAAFGWVTDMAFIKLTDQEISDVAAYLLTLVPADDTEGM